MVRRLLALVAALFVAGTGVAHAGDGYADEDRVTASSSTCPIGATCAFSAQTFQPGSTVTFTLFSDPVVLGTAIANAQGVATLEATIPAVDPGVHRIEASGIGLDGQPLTVSLEINVPAGTEVGGTDVGGAVDLPRTGADNSLPLSQLALTAIAGGGLLLLVANKRRSATTPEKVDAGR
jgi:hexosaminidase